VPIEEVRVGDRVWSRDERTGEEGYHDVARTFVTPNKPTVFASSGAAFTVGLLTVTATAYAFPA